MSTKDGVQYESRSEVDVRLEILNLTEKQRFMDGEKVSRCFTYLLNHILSNHCFVSVGWASSVPKRLLFPNG